MILMLLCGIAIGWLVADKRKTKEMNQRVDEINMRAEETEMEYSEKLVSMHLELEKYRNQQQQQSVQPTATNRIGFRF